MLKKVVPFIVLFIALLTVTFAATVCYLYFDMFSGEFSDEQSDWADFGSYIGGTIGGTVGALFAFLSFFALLYTVYLQREELTTAIIALKDSADSQRKQVENYEAQKFETTFYSLLDLHNQEVRKLDVPDNDLSG